MVMSISPVYIWIGVLIFCLVAEACTVQLVTVWFAIGSVGAIVAAAMGFSDVIQIIVCLVIAAVMLLLLRPVVRGKLSTKTDPTNADRILNQTAIVVQTINEQQETGQIRLMGQIWSARASDPNDCISEGETVVVTAISGVKAIVKRSEAK